MPTINGKTYNSDRANGPDSQTYVGPNHSFSNIDQFTLTRVAPKPNGSFKGVARAEAKLLRNTVLADTTVGIARMATDSSLPVGMTDAEIASLALDFISSIAYVDAGVLTVRTEYMDLLKKQDIHV